MSEESTNIQPVTSQPATPQPAIPSAGISVQPAIPSAGISVQPAIPSADTYVQPVIDSTAGVTPQPAASPSVMSQPTSVPSAGISSQPAIDSAGISAQPAIDSSAGISAQPAIDPSAGISSQPAIVNTDQPANISAAGIVITQPADFSTASELTDVVTDADSPGTVELPVNAMSGTGAKECIATTLSEHEPARRQYIDSSTGNVGHVLYSVPQPPSTESPMMIDGTLVQRSRQGSVIDNPGYLYDSASTAAANEPSLLPGHGPVATSSQPDVALPTGTAPYCSWA